MIRMESLNIISCNKNGREQLLIFKLRTDINCRVTFGFIEININGRGILVEKEKR